MLLPAIFTILLTLCRVHAKDVFAHFLVGNVASWTTANWVADIQLAQEAHIDAFALNVGYGDGSIPNSLANAFLAAQTTGFKLFISFDYTGGTAPWPEANVISLLNTYKSSSAYYKYLGKPFVSTFEGVDNTADWTTIKAQTGCFLVPNWSSLGAQAAVARGTADGLFSWNAWPWGNEDMNTYTDASYFVFLNQTGVPMPYMMPVSPWFYTNLPNYDKNWLWRGDDLWFDRWQEILSIDPQPEWVQIITWNDYGESHYIGPLHEEEYASVFDSIHGDAPYNFADSMTHDAWRQTLPFVIDTYKNGIATVKQEVVTAWYRLTSKDNSACSDGDTTGNTANQFQIEFYPTDVVQDKIFYSAVLAEAGTVTVTVGGVDLGATWTHTPSDAVGIYHGSVAYGSHIGDVIVTVHTPSSGSIIFKGNPIVSSCSTWDGYTNYNAYTGFQTGSAVTATPALNISEQVCIAGFGVNNFAGLCSFACGLGYCPYTACTCTNYGPQPTRPTAANTPGYGTIGYPAQGLTSEYQGLCSFNCFFGYCPPGACGTTNYGVVPETISPFLPPACVGGTGVDNLGGLCGYACPYGYCPIRSCTCTAQGVLNPPLPVIDGAGTAAPGLDDELYDGLCNFACSRGYCPGGACEYVTTTSNALLKNGTGVVNGGFRNVTVGFNGTAVGTRR
ncbi:putative alpha glucanase protein [Botrytis cinerea BcDW1]|uniref:Putative alpha glucanase protein n=1 Tax=Botryotinia fuckeliana (strain BcDW1) TaxID=1290391 RepID=M7U6E6_BOTF1|nr:putative alpha glucanase protein [Botrytis cinerea BcDW1]